MKTIAISDTFFKSAQKIIAIIALVCSLPGCTNFQPINYVFRPDSLVYNSPGEHKMDYRDVFLKTADNVQIHGWFLKAKAPAKGTVFVLHGNSQNISAHILSISWLPSSGYNVFIMDYRGYGKSTGIPGFPEIFLDIKTGLTWLRDNPEVEQKPLFLLGQSLGAALGIYFVGNDPDAKQSLSGVILDASFSRYRTIAKEVLAENWYTWIYQYTFPSYIPDQYDPEDYIAKISPLPILLMHSKQDKVVSIKHAEQLFSKAKEPKVFIETIGSHLQTFRYAQYREEMLDFMSRSAQPVKGWSR